MKICWDNLEKIEYRNGNFYRLNSKHKVLYKEKCLCCGEPFLIDAAKKGLFCTTKCSAFGEFNNFYGKTHSEENKKNWSDKQKLFRHSGKTKENMSKHRQGIENPFYGKHHTTETCRILHDKISGMFSLENHWNWIDGRSYLPYCLEWTKEYKESIKERDNYECQNPLCKSLNDLTVHHIDYIKKHCYPENLITLCRSCNSKANFDRDNWRRLYETCIYRIYKS